MNCKACGHALNQYGICPVCGWQDPSYGGQAPYNGQQIQYQQPSFRGQQMYNGQQPYNGQQTYYQQQPHGGQQQSYNGEQGYNQQQPYNNQQIYSGQQPYNGQPGYNQQPYNNQQMYSGQPGYSQQPYNNQQMYSGKPAQAKTSPASPPNKQGKKKWPLFAGIGGLAVVLAIGITLIVRNRPVKDLTNDDPDITTGQTTTHTTTETATTEHPQVAAGTKTLMIYMVGSDLESEHGAASTDIKEMLDSGFDDTSMNVLLYTGGCSNWQDRDIPEDSNTTFLIKDGKLEQLETSSASNMGNPDTLSEFLNYGYTNYPAETYGVILWNHGGGAFFGYGYDETTNDSLTLNELSDAFANSPFHDDNKLEFIGFDACLMANIETAHTLTPYANYMIASQESEPGFGWYYGFLKDIASLQSGKEIGTAIVDSYMDETTDYISSIPFAYCPICLSVMDLSQTDAVETALNDLFAKVGEDFSEATYSKYSSFRKNSKEIAADFSYAEGSYDVVDLMDYAKHLQAAFQPEALALAGALDSFIVYSDANEDKISGVSIYHPYYTKEHASQLIPMYQTFDFAANYTSYIAKFAGMLTDTDAFAVAWDPDSLVPVLNDDSSFSVTLQEDQKAALQNAYFVISKKDPENPELYDMVALSSAVTDDGTGTLTADFDGQITYMQNDTTLEMYELMYTVQEKTDTYTRYLLSSILYNDDIEGDDAVYAYFVLEVTAEHPEGQILGVYPIDNYIQTEGNEIFPDRYEIDINDYDNVAFGYFSHKYTSTEDLTNLNQTDWADLTINYNYFPISEGFHPVRGDLIAGEEYYGMFIFEDNQGNRHCSSLVQIQ